MKRFLKIAVVMAVAAVVAFGIFQLRQVLMVGAGFYAKMLCSGVFVSGRPAQAVIAEDVKADQSAALGYFSSAVDREQKRVDVWLPTAFAWQRAVYREGYGCHLVLPPYDANDSLPALPDMPGPASGALWPQGDGVATDTLPPDARDKLVSVIDTAFAETDPERAKRTRALVVVHRGRIVGERYAEGFTAQTPQLGWSMAKSVTNALAGALAMRGHISAAEAVSLAQWQEPGDPRAAITLDDLLRMSSGLTFDETYGGLLSDVRLMLFLRGNKAAFAASKPLECDPGECWHYSSGTSNIIASLLQNAAENGTAALAHELLFKPLGMRTAVFEPDASGTLVGSSYVYASAQDWARLGLLYLRGGIWNGERIFSREWLNYTLRPTEIAERFGAHVWLEPPGWNNREAAAAIPEDDFYFLGHDGQMVAVIPSRETVIVRLGLTRRRGPFDHARLVRDVLDALPRQ